MLSNPDHLFDHSAVVYAARNLKIHDKQIVLKVVSYILIICLSCIVL